MRYLSVCSGIEAATVAWRPLGWSAAAFSEVAAFPSALLAQRYPGVLNLGDMTRFSDWNLDGSIDLLCGGTPCQSFSVAGLRKGLDDPRGNLMLVYLAIAKRFSPRWLVWENVPGVLSCNGGRDFGTFLRALGECGYGFAYRVLDAQYFGVPQRRRRVFVVGCLRGWRPASAVLFERHSLSGDIAPGRSAGEAVAGTVSARTSGGGGLGADFDLGGGLVPEVARRLTTSNQRIDAETGTLIACFNWSAGAKAGLSVGDVAPTLNTHHSGNTAIAVNLRGRDGGATAELSGPVATALRASGGGGDKLHVLTRAAVRRLTPRECERLQGFPDDYTLIEWGGQPAALCPDGHRYKAIGNSWAVPVARWIGERISRVDALLASAR